MSTATSITIPPPFQGTTPTAFAEAHAVRTAVFVEEQRVPAERELDAADARSWHWVAYLPSSSLSTPSTPVGTVRIVPPSSPGGTVKMGRLATVRSERGRGVGRALVEAAVAWADTHREELEEKEGWDGRILIHAQSAVKSWYAALGFVEDEGMGEWVEEEMVHVGMWKTVGGKSGQQA